LFVRINSVHWAIKLLILAVSLIVVVWVRNMAQMLLLAAVTILKQIIGSGTVQLARRYYNIALLCRYETQAGIFEVLRNSYPADTDFVILPMDLDFIRAGHPKKNTLCNS